MPVIGAVAAIGGGLIASSGAKSAANAQTQSNQQAIAAQQAQYAQTRSDLLPYNQLGQRAAFSQADLLGLNGADKQQAAIAAQKSSPLYQSLFNNGQETLLQNAAATGGLRGGNTQVALADFGRDTLSQVIQNQLAQLGGVASLGENAAAITGNAGSNSANTIAQLLNNTGAAQGNAALTSAGAQIGAIQSLTPVLQGLFKNGSNTAAGSLTSVLNSGSGYFPGSAPSVSAGPIDIGQMRPF